MADNVVKTTFVGKDALTPVVAGINNTMRNFKRDAAKGFGLAAGANFANLAGDAFRFFVSEIQEATRAARDLQEQQTKNNYVFKDAADGVRAFARGAATGFGMSERAALQATGTIGNLLSTIDIAPEKAADLSLELTKLASDLASFNNRDVQEVLTALQAGLVGEAEPARRLGINISMARVESLLLAQGVQKTNNTFTDAQKIMARYQIMMTDSANAQGDFARTSGNLANQQRILDANIENLHANIGQLMMGPATTFVGWLNEIAYRLNPVAQGSVTAGMRELLIQLKLLDTDINGNVATVGRYEEVLGRAGATIKEVATNFSDLTGGPDGGAVVLPTEASEAVEGVNQGLLAMALYAGMSKFEFESLAKELLAAGYGTNEINFALKGYIELAQDGQMITGGITRSMVLLAQSAEAAGLEVKNSLRAYEIGVRGMEYTNVQPRTVFMSIKEQLKEFRKEINWLYKNPDALGRLIMRAGKIFDSKAFQSLWNQGQPGGSAGPLGEALTGNFIGFIASNLGTAGGGSTPFYGQGKRTEFERLGAMIGKQMGPKAGNAVMLAIKTAVEQGESPFVGFRGTVVVEKWMDAQGRTIPTGNLGMGAFTPTFVTGSGTGMSPDVEAALNDDGKNGPGRARGGPVRPYGTYVVGEKGPETLVMGSRAGYVIPNTGSQPIVVNVDGQKLFEIMNKRMGRAMAMGV